MPRSSLSVLPAWYAPLSPRRHATRTRGHLLPRHHGRPPANPHPARRRQARDQSRPGRRSIRGPFLPRRTRLTGEAGRSWKARPALRRQCPSPRHRTTRLRLVDVVFQQRGKHHRRHVLTRVLGAAASTRRRLQLRLRLHRSLRIGMLWQDYSRPGRRIGQRWLSTKFVRRSKLT
jgi:hypothetical protein